MSNLPPYSTFRTDAKQMMFPQATSHGNILTFTPPGFTQSLNVKFPDSRLAVCEKCKKNFKTRDMCRVRNTHTGAPWTTAYICLTLDESCTDENNNFVDKPLTVRMVQWQPYCVTQPFDPKTPVCAACKKTNRTRSFCRERHKHRQLPWCTVYVLLSALDAADPTTVVAGASKPLDEDAKEVGEDRGGDAKEYFGDVKKATSSPTNAGGQDETTSKASDSVEGGADNNKQEQKEKASNGDGEDGDDIHDIAESRTFLAKVNCKSTSIHWLELTEYEANDSSGVRGMVSAEGAGSFTPPGAAKGADLNQTNYYSQHAHAMGYQQHQNALQNHQQYFYQMQQRHQQHYAAQQAAWQAQYNQQGVMSGGQPPHHGQPPAHHGQMPPASPQEGTPSPAPVTAGEAAAQQQRRNREMVEPAGGQQHQQQQQQPPPPQHGQQPQQGGQQGQQQQQWMLYQQMYQAQLPTMNSQSPPYQPQHAGRAPQGQPQDDQHSQGVMMPMPNNDQQQQQHYEQPMTPENGKGNHDESTKRQRLI